ncbi:hypothetical protein B566_EDAN011796 [Ephemera danica]|nr:hypothetical protein B566_EDAN011796 [Ephemera danica]
MGVSQEFDAILSELGNFGPYQLRQYFFLCLATTFQSAFCLVEQCGDENETSPFLPSWWTEAIPPGRNGGPSSCSMYEPYNNTMTTVVASSLLRAALSSSCSVSFDSSSVLTCDQWVYDGPERTILTEFLLTCPENTWKLTFVGTINGLGRLLGLPLSGYLSDRFGRKRVLVYTLLGASMLVIAQSAAPSYVFFVIFEFLASLFVGSIYSIVFIMAMELVGPKGRVVGGGLLVCSFSFGLAVLGLIAWALRDLRYILLVISSPGLLFVSYIWIFPESIRWLMMRGRMEEANHLINKAAKLNKVELSEELKMKLEKAECLTDDTEEKSDPTLVALKQVLRSRTLLLRLANCCFIWVTGEFVYYGLSVNSSALAGTENENINFILVALVEAPGYLIVWFGMTNFGRRRTLSLALLVGGISCFAQPFIPAEVTWAELMLYLISKITMTGALDTTYVYTSEMFPTRLRNSLLSTCLMVGQIGTMAAPQTPLMSKISPLLPMILFGSLALVACLLSLLLPETMGTTLPDSIEEAEKVGSSSAE